MRRIGERGEPGLYTARVSTEPTARASSRPILALDSGSPQVSVAIAVDGRLLAERTVAQERSSVRLLPMLAEALAEAGCALADLGGIVALQGPGSFTGLRVGLATALGLHQASGVSATAVPSFSALATQAPLDARRIVAAIDALRGEWFAQPFAAGDPPRPTAEPAIVASADLAALGECCVGFGVSRLADLLPTLRLVEAAPLAPIAAREASLRPPAWDAQRLSSPFYLRPPAVIPLAL